MSALRYGTCFRMLKIIEAFKQGKSVEEIYRITSIDPWFLQQIKELSQIKKDNIQLLKNAGFSDNQIGRLLDKETIFSERINGEFKLRRDFSIKKNNKVLIIEDVITTGKSSLECSELVSTAGAKIVGYACIIDRSKGQSAIKEKIVSQIELDIPTYTKDNLPKSLSLIKAVKPGSRNLNEKN